MLVFGKMNNIYLGGGGCVETCNAGPDDVTKDGPVDGEEMD